MFRLRFLIIILSTAGLLLSACAADEHNEHDGHEHNKLHISSAWVKAADNGMTAAFAQLHNETGSTLTITSVTTDASTTTELHETVTGADHSSTMQEATAGFTIEGVDNMLLEPGGNHLMLMDLTRPLLPGDEVVFTLTFDNGDTQEFTAVVKEFGGAEENYEGHGQNH